MVCKNYNSIIKIYVYVMELCYTMQHDIKSIGTDFIMKDWSNTQTKVHIDKEQVKVITTIIITILVAMMTKKY